ncbi:MAG: FAD-dependent oxidoreductase [Cyanobacteria bacterium SZAS-4]|nr:FAD-dependent oxidoreductase [Cyanobacteria bacterium SZAS-4]
MAKKTPAVIIVGGGLAGLTCAVKLHEAEVPFLLVEASDKLGGRVASDRYDNFILDRGFQVLLTAYPEAKRILDYSKLGLHAFYPGALVFRGGKLHKLADPFRHPLDAVSGALSPIGSLADKMQVGKLRQSLVGTTVKKLFEKPETTTEKALQDHGFSKEMIDSFFRPFLGGIFLDRSLKTSSRMFDFVFKMFSEGDTSLPARGMGAIADQLAAKLPASSIRMKSHVRNVQDGFVIMDDGDTMAAPIIVVATEGPEAAKLLGEEIQTTPARSVLCVYYAAQKAPFEEPILVLNGEGKGCVNNVCVPSNVARSYAPEGQHLVSVSVLGERDEDEDKEIDDEVRKDLKPWFGEQVESWRYLRSYKIKYALPDQSPPQLATAQRPVKLRPGIFVCGDHRDNASINGALASGRRAAEAVLTDLKAAGKTE